MSHLANMDVKLTDLTNQKVDTKQSTRLDAIQSQLHEMKDSILGHRSDLDFLNGRINRLRDSVVYVPQWDRHEINPSVGAFSVTNVQVFLLLVLVCTIHFRTFNHFYLLLFSLPAGKEQREQSVVKYQNISFIQNQSQAQTSNMSSFFPFYKRLLFQT